MFITFLLFFSGVGKTSLVTRYNTDVFYKNTSSTIGASFSNIITETEGYKVHMQVIITYFFLSMICERKFQTNKAIRYSCNSTIILI